MPRIQSADNQDFIEQLLTLPDVAAQKQQLEEHAALLSDQMVEALKTRADEFLRSDIQSSLNVADLILHSANLSNNGLYRALGLIAKGNALTLGGLGEYERAVELYDESAQIYHAHNCPVGEARAQIGKILALASLGQYDDAITIGERTNDVFAEHAEWYWLAIVTMNLGLIHLRLRDDIKALTLYDKARDLFTSLQTDESRKYLAMIEQNRSISLRNLGQFEASIQYA